MDFSKISEKIKNFFSKVYDFLLEDKKRSLIILLGLLIFLLILLLIISISATSGKKENFEKPSIVFTEELLIPGGPEVKEDYSVSRQTSEVWTEEETENWFTVPSAKEVEDLANANDNLISDVIGAAP